MQPAIDDPQSAIDSARLLDLVARERLLRLDEVLHLALQLELHRDVLLQAAEVVHLA